MNEVEVEGEGELDGQREKERNDDAARGVGDRPMIVGSGVFRISIVGKRSTSAEENRLRVSEIVVERVRNHAVARFPLRLRYRALASFRRWVSTSGTLDVTRSNGPSNDSVQTDNVEFLLLDKLISCSA